MKRRFFYCFSTIPCNFIIFNLVFNLTKINDVFHKLAGANCRARGRTNNAHNALGKHKDHEVILHFSRSLCLQVVPSLRYIL